MDEKIGKRIIALLEEQNKLLRSLIVRDEKTQTSNPPDMFKNIVGPRPGIPTGIPTRGWGGEMD